MKICAVSYLNTKPFLEGVIRLFPSDEIKIDQFVPSKCADEFYAGNYDVALIPVGSLINRDTASIVPEFCIGSKGKVDSVFVLSEEPIHKLEFIVLDGESLTSNGLTKVLFEHHWKRQVKYISEENSISKINGTTGAVAIGDKAIQAKDRFTYVYDLAEEWKKFSGLPFAFAIWAYNADRIIDKNIDLLIQAFHQGIGNIKEVAEKWSGHFNMTKEETVDYFQNSIDYDLDALKKEAINKYLTLLTELTLGKDSKVCDIQYYFSGT